MLTSAEVAQAARHDANLRADQVRDEGQQLLRLVQQLVDVDAAGLLQPRQQLLPRDHVHVIRDRPRPDVHRRVGGHRGGDAAIAHRDGGIAAEQQLEVELVAGLRTRKGWAQLATRPADQLLGGRRRLDELRPRGYRRLAELHAAPAVQVHELLLPLAGLEQREAFDAAAQVLLGEDTRNPNCAGGGRAVSCVHCGLKIQSRVR